MYLNFMLRALVVGSAVSLTLLVTQMSYAQEPSSFKSWNYPDRYIRHRNLLGHIDRIVARDKLGRSDATFRLIPGLAGKCNSFESANHPGHFLRHQNYRFILAKQTADQVFKQDATFCVVSGLAGSEGRSFESVNFPTHYVRHLNYELWLAKSDGSQTFKKDATFILSPPLTVHPPAEPIDPGTKLNPAISERCGRYASEAVVQFYEMQARKCGFSGRRWQENYNAHHGWCLTAAERDRGGEAGARSYQLRGCSSGVQSPGSLPRGEQCSVSVVIRNQSCLNADGTPSSLTPGASVATGCGSNVETARARAKLNFASTFGCLTDALAPGCCTVSEEVVASCLCN